MMNDDKKLIKIERIKIDARINKIYNVLHQEEEKCFLSDF